MSRLIDATQLVKQILIERDNLVLPYKNSEKQLPKHYQFMRSGLRKALKCIENARTIDAIEVVRCKDCKKAKLFEGKLICHEWMKGITPMDYCSHGERRNENENV